MSDLVPMPGPPDPTPGNPTVSTVSISATDPAGLARFYERLLGWTITDEEPDWVLLRPPGGGTALSFQAEAAYTPPVWPAGAGDQHMQLHLEVRVEDLAAATEHALACGARLAHEQPQDDVRVCLDPAGHPFCLWLAA